MLDLGARAPLDSLGSTRVLTPGQHDLIGLLRGRILRDAEQADEPRVLFVICIRPDKELPLQLGRERRPDVSADERKARRRP